MDFDIPKELVAYLEELDAFIEREILPLERSDDNIRFFDHRREDARTDWERGGLPLKVWVYGDGESSRMLSELHGMLAGTNITATGKTPMKSTSAYSPDGNQTVAVRMYRDLVNAGPVNAPNLIHIGYSAGAHSYGYCGYVAPGEPTMWKQNVQTYALDEAYAIRDGVNFAAFAGIRVLITKGPGVPAQNAVVKAPLIARSSATLIADACMADAFFWVAYDLAALGVTAYWVDYSGMTVDSRLGGSPVTDWKLDPSNVWHWEQDGVHVSTDKLKFDAIETPPQPLHPPPATPPGYSQSFTVGSASGQVPQAQLGAYREAKNVLRAYQAIQAML